ncbi:MAG: AraC family transcriptional regulator [Oscillospiraceae bacterium]|nr:AraC family transcriptional regulator [Oscillospiraceae bacterium]
MDTLFPAEQSQHPLDNRISKSPSPAAQRTFFYLQECGHLKAGNHHHTSRQNLQSFLFAIVIGGKGSLNYDGRHWDLECGDCFFIDCRVQHIYQSDAQSPWELLWIHFNGCTSEEYYKMFAEHQQPVIHPVSTLKFVSVLQEILRLNAETYADTEILTSNLIVNLLTMLLTVNTITEESDSALHTKLRNVMAHLDTNFTADIRLDDLAKRFDISKYYLTREFKRAYGETIFQHIISMRINYAKRLLRFTDKSVEEIAMLCGFKDQSYFSKQFKRAENITCLAFRRRWRD